MKNKGQKIRELIEAGFSNEKILVRVDTTINSIRWHRSKMAAGTSPIAVRGNHMTVGQMLDSKPGYAEHLVASIKRLGYLDHAAEKFAAEVRKWTFKWNSKVGGRFGQCQFRNKVVEVHKCLETLEHDFHETLFHEIAHALDLIINGRPSGHQLNWKVIMIAMGLPTNATGNPSAAAKAALCEVRKAKSAFKKPADKWRCQGCGHEELLYRKRKHPASAYRHRKCGGRFESVAV